MPPRHVSPLHALPGMLRRDTFSRGRACTPCTSQQSPFFLQGGPDPSRSLELRSHCRARWFLPSLVGRAAQAWPGVIAPVPVQGGDPEEMRWVACPDRRAVVLVQATGSVQHPAQRWDHPWPGPSPLFCSSNGTVYLFRRRDPTGIAEFGREESLLLILAKIRLLPWQAL